MLSYTFRHFFAVFHHKICVFIIFISFFDKVSNFRNSILTNQKRELVVYKCQWNCMLHINFLTNNLTIYTIQQSKLNVINIILLKHHFFSKSTMETLRTMCEICSKITLKTPERSLQCWLWADFTHCFGVFIVDIRQVNAR